MLRDAQLLPAEGICEMITEEADTVTTLSGVRPAVQPAQ